MKNIFNLNISAIVIGLLLLFATGCDKTVVEVENESPTISFLQPESDLVITKDTTISFIVAPIDTDGTIDSVVFTRNGINVQTIVSPPYQYDWSIATGDHAGIHTIKAIAYDNHNATGEAELQVEIQLYYLKKWVGLYEGTSRHWTSQPSYIDGVYGWSETEDFRNVSVNVALSNQDSCLDLTIKYNSKVEKRTGLKFSETGFHYTTWSGGSSFGSLRIIFKNDSLEYNYGQKCGIPCQSGIDYVIGKK